MSESKSIILYKRNAQGKPIFWSAEILGHKIILKYGIVGKEGTTSEYVPPRGVEKEWKTIVAAKRREGGMELSELYDAAPQEIPNIEALKHYLDMYLPKYNTNNEGFVLPMLAKIYELRLTVFVVIYQLLCVVKDSLKLKVLYFIVVKDLNINVLYWRIYCLMMLLQISYSIVC